MVLGILKSPNQQINYGTGKDVSDETIADAGRAADDPVVKQELVRASGKAVRR